LYFALLILLKNALASKEVLWLHTGFRIFFFFYFCEKWHVLWQSFSYMRSRDRPGRTQQTVIFCGKTLLLTSSGARVQECKSSIAYIFRSQSARAQERKSARVQEQKQEPEQEHKGKREKKQEQEKEQEQERARVQEREAEQEKEQEQESKRKKARERKRMAKPRPF
jgi:predicted membrane metal-binding protein